MSYKGTAADGDRAALLLKEREKRRQELERQKQEIARKEEIAGRNIGAKFATTQQDFEAQLRAQTYGLVTLEEMKKRQQLLEEERVRKQKADDEGDKHKKKRKKKQQKVTVSFDEEDELGDDDVAESDAVAKKAKVVKDPTVDTSFLPDREREEQEKRDRERLRAEWIEKTKAMKEELIEITYSYWDGSGHRRTIQMKKGDSIQQFLQAVLADLRGEFHELRGVTAENLMYVKEDLIIPSHYTFYDFIITKARGKSGPLFNFDVHDDVRLLNDATVEKDESHAGKVMLRSWYERNKHIFPASRWEPYDPEKKWEKYSISDKGKARA